VLLANPRGFCAGVDRAVRIVEAALDLYGKPVYVRHEIVHNHHVLAALTARGAVFVRDLAEVPPGVTVIFSAHGVSPAVWQQAAARQLNVIDATCPLVTKVHQEVARHARTGRTVFLVGHRDHPEVVGTLGHYSAGRAGGDGATRIKVIESEADAEAAEAGDGDDVAYVTQTTLSVDGTAAILAILKRRFPQLVGPRTDDICYATQNRQRAVRTLAAQCDVIIVIGADHSSNSMRLREAAAGMGVPAYLVDHCTLVERGWFDGVRTIGVTSGASVPEMLVQELLGRFRGWWPDMVEESIGEAETVHFRMPRELMQREPDGVPA
jgi:4-hydroxy-3-methylbut-2-enyl diphosphate reductase